MQKAVTARKYCGHYQLSTKTQLREGVSEMINGSEGLFDPSQKRLLERWAWQFEEKFR